MFEAIRTLTGMELEVTPSGTDRSAANARWFLSYTKGVMDTDSLRDLVFGELYIPLQLKHHEKISLEKRWTFNKVMAPVLDQFACRFDNPFWDPKAEVSGKTRKMKIRDDPETTITEVLESASFAEYSYILEGLDGIFAYHGRFSLQPNSNNPEVDLVWNVSFQGRSDEAVLNALTIVALAQRKMTEAMAREFGPAGRTARL